MNENIFVRLNYDNVGKTINHPWLGMVNIRPIKMVMTGVGFMALCYPHYHKCLCQYFPIQEEVRKQLD